MSQEVDFPLTEEKIFAAERRRATGNHLQAYQDTKSIYKFPLHKIPSLTKDAQKRLLMAARVNVVAIKELAVSYWEAPTVAAYLTMTRNGITEIYRYPLIVEIARALDTDTQDNPYAFYIEMRKDEISYSLAVGELSGNPEVYGIAKGQYTNLIGETPEPSIQTELIFRLNRLIHEQEPTGQNYESLRQAFHEAVKASNEAKKFERVATIASRFALDAQRQGHLVDFVNGILANIGAIVHDRSTLTIWLREVYKEYSEPLRTSKWRATTPPGIDYSYLKLPE